MEKFRLTCPRKEDRQQAIAYIRELQDCKSEIHGTGGLERYLNDYDGWLQKLESDRRQPKTEDRVPTLTLFLMRRNTEESRPPEVPLEDLVGMVNIRLGLTSSLYQYGGHIGYSIRPSERRKGYGKILLYLTLKICLNHDIPAVLIGCNKNNAASAKIIQALSGKLLYEGPHIDPQHETPPSNANSAPHQFIHSAPEDRPTVQKYVIIPDEPLSTHHMEYLSCTYPD